MKRGIPDAHALMVFLEKEPGFEKVASFFIEAVEKDNRLLMTSVNFGEVYYIILRECGQEKAYEVGKIIQSLPVEIVDVEINIAREAAHIKALRKIFCDDCFAAALAKLNKGELITGDKEYQALKNEVKISWMI